MNKLSFNGGVHNVCSLFFAQKFFRKITSILQTMGTDFTGEEYS